MPIGLTSGLRVPVEVNMAQYEVRNRYHSQGLAAGGSALLDAVNRGKVHLAKFILDAGEYDVVNTRDFKGKTPLIRACYIKEEKTRGKAIDLLLNKGADVNMQDDVGRTALSYACEMRTNDVVKILVKNNVDPDIADEKGNTALIYSAMVGNDTAIEILIRSFRRLGLNVDHVNNEGLTALLIAAKNGFIESASILSLEGKACISFRDREKGMNAEEWARAQGCSTPEVLSFSPQAALLNYRPSRLDPSGRGNEAGTSTDQDDLFSARATRRSSKTRVKISPPPRRMDRDDDMDDMTRRFNSIRTHSPTDSFKVSSSPRHKRGSLPIIKFSGLFSKNNDGDSHMSLVKSGKKSPEGGFMRKRKSSKDHSRNKSPTAEAVRPQSADLDRSRSRKSSASRDEPDGQSQASSQVSLELDCGAAAHVVGTVAVDKVSLSSDSTQSTVSTVASASRMDVDLEQDELGRYHCFTPVEESEPQDSLPTGLQAGHIHKTGIALNPGENKLA